MIKKTAKTKPTALSIEQQLAMLQRTVQTLVIVVFILVIAVGALFVKDGFFTNKQDQVLAQQDPQPVKVEIKQIKELFKKGNIYFGNKDSKYLFVEVADPSCPWCHVAAGKNPELSREIRPDGSLVPDTDGGPYQAPVVKMKELVDQGKAAFVWLYQNGHGAGEMGTKAFYCAHEQGKFWEAHDLLMSSAGYELLNNVVQNDKAKSTELTDFLAGVTDSALMKECLDSGKYDGRMAQDAATAVSLGISGTPGFFINTKNFSGAYSWVDMQPALE